MNIIDQADAVCVFGLGAYFEDAFFQQNVKERFHVSLLCDNNRERLKEIGDRINDSSLKCITPEHLPEYGNVAVILMLGDTRSAARQLSEIVGAANCLAYNDLVLDEVMDGSRDKNWFTGELKGIRKGFGLLESDESRKIYVK